MQTAVYARLTNAILYLTKKFRNTLDLDEVARIAVSLVFLIVIAGVLPARAGESTDLDVLLLNLKVGEDFDLCNSGEIICPARGAICDDPKVAAPVSLPSGLGFQGIARGTTLCSAMSAVGPRVVFRITVR